MCARIIRNTGANMRGFERWTLDSLRQSLLRIIRPERSRSRYGTSRDFSHSSFNSAIPTNSYLESVDREIGASRRARYGQICIFTKINLIVAKEISECRFVYGVRSRLRNNFREAHDAICDEIPNADTLLAIPIILRSIKKTERFLFSSFKRSPRARARARLLARGLSHVIFHAVTG